MLWALLKGSFEEIDGLWHVPSGCNFCGLDEKEVCVVAHGFRRLSVRNYSQLHTHGIERLHQHLEVEFVFVSSPSLQAAVEYPVANYWMFVTSLLVQACIAVNI